MRISYIAALCLGTAMVSNVALADGSLLGALTAPSADANDWFGQVGGGVRVQDVPEIEMFHDSNADTDLFAVDPSVVMGGGALTVGHVFGKQLDPQIWGGRAHMSATAYYYVGSDTESLLSTTAQSAYFVDSTGALNSMDDTVAAESDVRLQDWGGTLRGGLDFDQGNGLWLTPSVAFFGARSTLDQRVTAWEDSDTPLPNFFDEFRNTVTNTRFGTAAGLGATYVMGSGFTLRAGVQLGVTYNISKASIDSCMGTPTTSTPVCNGAYLSESISREDNGFGFTAAGGLGLGFDIGFGSINLEGEVGYDSYVATVDYGNRVGEATRIAQDGALSYGGGVSLTIPLN